MDVRHRARRPGRVEVLADGTAQQVGLEAVGGGVVERRQVGDRVPAHDPGDRRCIRVERGQRRQLAARRRAPQVGTGRVDAEVAGVVAQPGERRERVVDLGGEARLAAEAVFRGGDHEAGVGEAGEEPVVPRPGLAGWQAAVADPPAAAVEVDEQRRPGTRVARARPVHVQLQRAEPLQLGVDDGLLDIHRTTFSRWRTPGDANGDRRG
jgi:hypothetical protein